MRILRKLCIVILFFAFSLLWLENVNGYTFGGANYVYSERVYSNDLAFGVKHYNDVGQTGLEGAKLLDQSINVLEIPSSEDLKIVSWTISKGSRWTMSPVRTIAADYELNHPGYRVIGAINGDFFDINGTRPLPYATQGIHVSGGNSYKSLNYSDDGYRGPIGFKNDGSMDPLVGNAPGLRNQHMTLAIYNENDVIVKEFDVEVVNKEPGDNQTAVFYGLWENRQVQAVDVTGSYIVRDGEFVFAYSANDFFGKGKITTYGSESISEGDFAIKTNNPSVQEALTTGTKIRVQYDLAGDFAGVEEASGAGKPIIYDGEFMPDDTDFGVARHPRTMIGRKADGTIVMTVVDGRQPTKGMNGVSQKEMGSILSYYGCVEAYNLDGGGSSTMLILNDGKYEVVNSPSDNRERSDSNALLVVAKVPEVDINITNITQSSLTIEADIVDLNGYDFTDLYIGMNGTVKKVESGRADFDALESNTLYTYSFYYKKEDNLVMIPIQSQTKTLKQVPKVEVVLAYFDANNLIFELLITDVDLAVVRKNIRIGTLYAGVNDNKAIFYNFEGSLSEILLNYSYDIGDGAGRQEIQLTEFRLQGDLEVAMNITRNKLRDQFLGFWN